MSTQTMFFSIDLKGILFYTGLTFVITGANSNLLISYE
jgi:hypothetical protein